MDKTNESLKLVEKDEKSVKNISLFGGVSLLVNSMTGPGKFVLDSRLDI